MISRRVYITIILVFVFISLGVACLSTGSSKKIKPSGTKTVLSSCKATSGGCSCGTTKTDASASTNVKFKTSPAPAKSSVKADSSASCGCGSANSGSGNTYSLTSSESKSLAAPGKSTDKATLQVGCGTTSSSCACSGSVAPAKNKGLRNTGCESGGCSTVSGGCCATTDSSKTVNKVQTAISNVAANQQNTVDQLNLTNEQEAKLAAIDSKYEPRSAELRSKLTLIRNELSKLADDPNIDENTLREKVRELSDVQSELQLSYILENREKNQVYTSEQRTILASVRSGNGSGRRNSVSVAGKPSEVTESTALKTEPSASSAK